MKKNTGSDNARGALPPRASDLSMPGQILLVDDDAIFREEFRECFPEYDFVEASSGEAALALLRRPHEIELVLLDVRMAGMSGIETLRHVRKIAPTARIIIFTGHSSTSVAVAALRGQADDFLEKPLDLEATRALFKKYLGNRRGQPAIDALGAKDKIERVKDYLRRNARKKVTLADAAAIIHLSPKHLSRLFRQQTGQGFSDYKLSFKIAEAKRLLLGSGYTVAQIALTLGYENPESLIRQFKLMVRLTPTAFRRKRPKAKK